MVTGACETGESTEIYTEGGKRWKIVGPLPKPAYGIRGVSLENKIIMTGICSKPSLNKFDVVVMLVCACFHSPIGLF